jgi:HK97 family phage portal protein
MLGRVIRWAARGTSLASEDAARIFGSGSRTLSGVNVSESTALEAPSYFAGVRNIAEDLATLPLITYRKLGAKRRERDEDFYLYPILHDQPNEEMDATVFVESMQAHLMMRRNCYAEIVRGGGGRCQELWPIHPSRVTIERVREADGSAGPLVYRVSLPDGQRDPRTGEPFSRLDRSRMLHIRSFVLDGVEGKSSLVTHSESIGLALALERYGAAFFGNDATPGGVYEVPALLSDKAYDRLRRDLEGGRAGLDKKHRSMLLEEGTKFHEITVPNDKAQFVDSQRASTEQMGRINRIPPHLIGDLTRATFSNIEHQGIDYVVHSIRPHAVRWERAIRLQVYLAADRRSHYSEFLLDALMRGDAQSRANTLAVWRQNGVINADEWRELENFDEIGGEAGEAYLVNGNMLPVEQILHRTEPQAAPAGARMLLPLYRAAAERCVRKEAAAIDKALDRVLKADGMRAFEAWLAEFYRLQADTVRQAFVPLFVATGEAVRGETGPDLGDWGQAQARGLAAARQKAAQEEIRAIVASAPSDLVGALHGMTARWLKEEPERIAVRELDAAVEGARKQVAERMAALVA